MHGRRSVASARGGLVERQLRRQQVRVLGERPADHDRDHRQRRRQRARGRSARVHTSASVTAAGERRDDHHRQPAAGGQAVEERGRVVAQDEQPAERDDAARRRRRRARARGTRARGRAAGAHASRRRGRPPRGRRRSARRSRRSAPTSGSATTSTGRRPRCRPARGRTRCRRAPRRSRTGSAPTTSANSAPSTRASLIVAAWPRSANAVPRKMIPIAARKSGIESVEKIEPKATGNAVHTITSTKISQTWLASQTGLIERWIIPRTPAAALGAAGGQVPEAGAEVGAAEHRVGGDAEHDEAEADLGQHQRARPPSPAACASRRSSQTTAAPRPM